jgi:hypothetical protein
VKRGPLATALALLSAVAAVSCTTSPRGQDSFSAEWSTSSGRQREVRFSWQSRGTGVGKLQTKLGPERFEGYYARIHEQGAPIITSVYKDWGDQAFANHAWGPGWDGFEPVDYATFVRAYSGRVLASLSGSAGSALRCNLETTRPERGVLAGARGRCQVSDGGFVKIDF